MLFIYPAIFHKEDSSYWVEFPDLQGCNTFGDTLEETMENAKEALEGYCITILECGETLPSPSDIQAIEVPADSFVSLVDCKPTNTTQKAVKKTLTIPYWLNEVATKENINFSAILQDGLKRALHIAE